MMQLSAMFLPAQTPGASTGREQGIVDYHSFEAQEIKEKMQSTTTHFQGQSQHAINSLVELFSVSDYADYEYKDAKLERLEVPANAPAAASRLGSWLADNADQLKSVVPSWAAELDDAKNVMLNKVDTQLASPVEDKSLLSLTLFQIYNTCVWATLDFTKKGTQRTVRPPDFKLQTSKTEPKPWSKEEDEIILSVMTSAGELKNQNVPERLRATVENRLAGRSYSASRSHWTRSIFPRLKEDGSIGEGEQRARANAWTKEEDAKISKMKKDGKKMAEITAAFPHRKPFAVQSRWQILSKVEKENAAPDARDQDLRKTDDDEMDAASEIGEAGRSNEDGVGRAKTAAEDQDEEIRQQMQWARDEKTKVEREVKKAEQEEKEAEAWLQAAKARTKGTKRKAEAIDDCERQTKAATTAIDASKAAAEAAFAAKAKAVNVVNAAQKKVTEKMTTFRTVRATESSDKSRVKDKMGAGASDQTSLNALAALLNKQRASHGALTRAKAELDEAKTAKSKVEKNAKTEVDAAEKKAAAAKKAAAEALAKAKEADDKYASVHV